MKSLKTIIAFLMTFFCWVGLWPLVLAGYTFKFLFNQAVKVMKGIVNEP